MFFRIILAHYKVYDYITIINLTNSILEISLAEKQLGNFLTTSSIDEHTSSANTMEKSGKLLSSLSTKRLNDFHVTVKPTV